MLAGSNDPWTAARSEENIFRSKRTNLKRVKLGVARNGFAIGGLILGGVMTYLGVGGSHMGLSYRGRGWDIGPAWKWGALGGGAVGHTIDRIRAKD
jgi:hypothetical protein